MRDGWVGEGREEGGRGWMGGGWVEVAMDDGWMGGWREAWMDGWVEGGMGGYIDW